jgi:hypothetical protein
MNFNDIINTKFNKNSIFLANNKAFSQFNFEISSEDDINEKQSKDENYIINLDTELKTSIKEDRNIKSNIINNEFKINNFNFFIYNCHQAEHSNNNNEAKNKNNEKFNIKLSAKRGRKKKRDITNVNGDNMEKEKRAHNKYSDDNMRKKCKNIILKFALEFLNKKIKEQYDNNIGRGKFRKELKILNQDEKVNSTVNIEKSFLFKTLKDIFSENISARLSNFQKNHNKLLIESLITEKDEEKKQYFIKLFNITFLDCLKYFRGEETGIGELEGFKTISSIKETLIEEQGEEYFDLFMYYMKNFKDIIESKKARKKKKLKIKIQKNY